MAGPNRRQFLGGVGAAFSFPGIISVKSLNETLNSNATISTSDHSCETTDWSHT